MGTIRKVKGKWRVEIRKKGYPKIYKSFFDVKDARRFAREVESQMERNVFEDYSGAAGTSLKALLIKYRDEITSKKRGVREETSKINYLIRHWISRHVSSRQGIPRQAISRQGSSRQGFSRIN